MTTIPAAVRHAAAAAIGLNEQYLYQCLSGRKRTPAEHCPPIEKALDGKVTCESLRPDIKWHRVPDPAWPHPDGRPLIDVAAAAVQE